MGTLGDLHIPAALINSLEELTVVTTELSARAKSGELYYAGGGPFCALCLDSLTGVGVFLEKASCELKGIDMIWGGELKDPRGAYPYIMEKGRQIVTRLMSLPVPLFMFCREGLMTEGEGKEAKTYAVPELPGQKLPRELPGWPEATLRMRILNGRRVFVTENEGDVIARIRLQEGLRCPKHIKPDLGAVLRLLQGDASALEDLQLPQSKPAVAPPKPQLVGG